MVQFDTLRVRAVLFYLCHQQAPTRRFCPVDCAPDESLLDVWFDWRLFEMLDSHPEHFNALITTV